jgi:hypothetical protein
LPDFRHRQRVQIQRLSEGSLLILPSDKRTIISSVVENAKVTYHIEPGAKAQLASVRLAAYASCVSLANQLQAALAKLDQVETHSLRNALAAWLTASAEHDAR